MLMQISGKVPSQFLKPQLLIVHGESFSNCVEKNWLRNMKKGYLLWLFLSRSIVLLLWSAHYCAKTSELDILIGFMGRFETVVSTCPLCYAFTYSTYDDLRVYSLLAISA